MAIQQINLGSAPSGAGGDTQRAANAKINQNFSNTEHAASRLVGTRYSQLPQSQDINRLAFGPAVSDNNTGSVADYEAGVLFANASVTDKPPMTYTTILTFAGYANTRFQLAVPYTTDLAKFYIRARGFSSNTPSTANYQAWGLIYTSQNTTKDTATGFLKASSPVLHVYNDTITKIHEAEQLDITVDKKGVGHYEIHGTTGLRKNDGWFMSPPRDVHGNVLCMVDLDEKDGVVILKTYKKKFDFETVSIVHDYENPMDIPEGVCVEFRFNDLPEELINEPIE